MAMNKQRKTSNVLNILNYDDAGNIVIKDYGQVTRYSWNGLIHGFVGPVSVSSVSAATTDTDRFLVSDGGVLKYRTGVELLSDIGGVPSTRTLTINGVTQDLSADRTFTIAAGISGTITTGQVAFGSGTNTIGGSSNLFWDNANSRLGIGTASPDYELVVTKPASSSFKINTGANSVDIISTTSLSPHFVNNFLFYYGIPGSGVNKMTLFGATGNLVLQNGGTFLDGGQRLQVYGDAYIKGSGATSGTTALTIQNSGGTNIFRVRNDSYVMVNGDLWIEDDFRRIYAGATRNSVSRTSTGTSTIFYNALQLAATNSAWSFLSDQAYTLTLGDISGLNVRNTFAPTSGTATFNHLVLDTRINQTGGANGITRGLYVNPTLTAAADWRSIEWSNNSGWGLYGNGTAQNYLGGRLGINSTSVNAVWMLGVSGNLQVSGFLSFGATNVGNSNAYIDVGASEMSIYAHTGRKMSFWTDGTIKATLTSAGRLLLGTTTEGTFLLDVNGTARVSGKLLTSSAEDDFGGATTFVRRNNANLWFYTSATVQGGIGAATGTGFRSIYLSGVYNGYTNDAVYIGTSTTAGTYFQNTYMKIGGLPTSYTATAILELESTTRGFLPPRMTTTQKNAITTPAEGLVVYDSTTNVPNYYDGTAWVGMGGGGASIYTSDGTLTSNRTVSSGGFSLVFNPQTAFVTTLSAATNDSTTALVSQNTLSYASGFSSTNIGSVYGAVAGINRQTFAGSATFEQANLATAAASVNSIDFSATGATITMLQPVSSGIRAMTGHQAQIQYQGTNSGTITHAAVSQNLGFYRPSAATGTLTITNAYSLLINDLNDYSSGFTFTNRWAIYQDGASDNNYFKGKVVIGSTSTVGASPLNVKNLPTSATGLATGDIWNNGGVLNVV